LLSQEKQVSFKAEEPHLKKKEQQKNPKNKTSSLTVLNYITFPYFFQFTVFKAESPLNQSFKRNQN